MLVHLHGRTFETIKGTDRAAIEHALGTNDLYQGVDQLRSVIVFAPRQKQEKEATTVYRFLDDAYHQLEGDWPRPWFASAVVLARCRYDRDPPVFGPLTADEVATIRMRWEHFLPYDEAVEAWNNRPEDDDRAEPIHSIDDDEGMLTSHLRRSQSSSSDDGSQKRSRDDDSAGRASKRQRVEGWIFVGKDGDAPFDDCDVWEPDPDDADDVSELVREAWEIVSAKGGDYMHRVLERFSEDGDRGAKVPAEFVDVLPLLKKKDVEVFSLRETDGTDGAVSFLRYKRHDD